MAEQIANYQCPACTAPLQYSPETEKLECEFCGSSFETEEIEAQYREKEEAAARAMEEAAAKTQWDNSGVSDDWGSEAADMRAYTCPSCGAELICQETTAATACPYCGNPTVVPGQFSGALRPDYVIPFALSKEQAIQALKKHYKGKIFLPGTFLSQQTLEKVQGVYVPFWLYDGTVKGQMRFAAARTRVYRQGQWEITETNHYDVLREGTLAFEKVPVDASSKMPDEYMDSIEPYDYAQLKPFSTAYLPGFMADKYDMTAQAGNDRADQRCLNTMEQALQDTVLGYTQCLPRGKHLALERGKTHYALLPVWLLNVKWEDRIYLFAVNGQTGRTVGVLPASKKKALAFFAGLTTVLSAAGTLLTLVFG